MIGAHFGNYRIIAPLGSGGMGAVYSAEHQRIHRRAAIKILLPEMSASPEAVRRFFIEALATSRIKHPGIVEIFDCDVDPSGHAFIVMELLEGMTLAERLRATGPLDSDAALSLVGLIANALAAAHERGILHRDLKPDNIFLVPAVDDEASAVIKVLDFGVAKLIAEGSAMGIVTRTGFVMGSPPYMSPEQCRGSQVIDQRSDIYSLGCMLFEMVCGRPPFTSGGPGELMVAHIAQIPPRPSSLAPEIPGSVEALIESMLAKTPADRPSSMAEVEGRVAAIRSQSSGAMEPPRQRAPVGFAVIPTRGDDGETDRIRPRRLPRLMILLGAASAAVAVVFTAFLFRGPRHDEARSRQPSSGSTPQAPAAQAMPLSRPMRARPLNAHPPPSTNGDDDVDGDVDGDFDGDGDGDGDGPATPPAKRVLRPGARPRRSSGDEDPDLMTFGEAERRTHGTGAGKRKARPTTDATGLSAD